MSSDDISKPHEPVMFAGVVGLPDNAHDRFEPYAPMSGCRICGAVYQSKYHREVYTYRSQLGVEPPTELLARCLDDSNEWREKHTKLFHSEEDIESFHRTGFAFTPEAAHKLAPFGVIPMGNMHEDIADAMFEAPRAPDFSNLEGGDKK